MRILSLLLNVVKIGAAILILLASIVIIPVLILGASIHVSHTLYCWRQAILRQPKPAPVSMTSDSSLS